MAVTEQATEQAAVQSRAAEPEAGAPGGPNASLAARLWAADKRNEIGVLVALGAATLFLPRSIPPGIYALGLVGAATVALNAIGMVLVYRSNRIINFAQVAPGAGAAMIFVSLVRYKPALHAIDFLCEDSCTQNSGLVQANYWISLVLCLGLSVVFGWLIYAVVVRRFARAPRLLLTVTTVLVGPMLAGITRMAATGFLVPTKYKTGELGTPGGEAVRFPSDFTFSIRPTIFHASDVLAVEVAALAVVGLILFLRMSSTGTAIRAAAADPDRAATLGVDVHAVTSRVWILAALLSGVAALLAATAFSGTVTPEITVPVLIRTLAVAVIARMVSVPMAAVAAVGLGVFEQSMLYAFDSATLFEGSLFVVVGLMLVLQTAKLSRAEQAQVGAWRAAKEIRPIPDELRGLPTVRKWIATGTAAATVALIGLPWVLSPGDNTLAAAMLLYLAIGFSVLVLTGWAGQISLGQLGLAAVGGYAAAVTGLPFPFALLFGGVVAACAALIVGLPALRLRGLHLAIMTLTFAVAVNAVLLNERHLGGPLPRTLRRPVLLGMRFDDERVFYYFCLLFVAAIAFAVLGLRRSRTGRTLLGLRDNEQAAQTFGINLVRARLGAFMASGFIAGITGAVYAYHQRGVKPSSFDPQAGIDLFLFTVVGGLGSIAGPVIGIVLYSVPTFFSLPELVRILISGPGLLVLLLLLPGGVGQLIYDGRDNLLRKIAARNRILVPSLIADMRKEQMRRRRAHIAVKTGAGGAFVASRYRLADQWAIDPESPAVQAAAGGAPSA